MKTSFLISIISLILFYVGLIYYILKRKKNEKIKGKVLQMGWKLPYQFGTTSSIENLLKITSVFLCGVFIFGVIAFLASNTGTKTIASIISLIILLVVLYITYRFGRLFFLLPERKIELELQGLSPEEIIRKVLKECKSYINNVYQFKGNGDGQLMKEHYCDTLMDKAASLLNFERKSLVDVFLNGVDLPIIKRDFLARKANQRDLEQLEERKQQLSEVAARLGEISEKLDQLPTGIIFPPEDLKNKIRYDISSNHLIFKGVMSKEEKDKLLNLSQDVPYRKAIEALFQKSLVEEEIKRLTGEEINRLTGEEINRLTGIIELIGGRMEKIRNRITDLESDRFQMLSYVITRVLNEPSTGKACRNYMRKLSGILKISTEENWKENVRFLKTLVDLRKGVPISELLDIKHYEEEGIELLKVYSEEFNNLSNLAIHDIYENFRKYCQYLCPQENKEGRYPVITIGYSQVVRRVMANCAKKCNRYLDIYILYPQKEQQPWLHEVEVMEIELKGYTTISPQIIDLDTFMDNDLHEKINYMLLGAENVKTDGHVFHPSDLKRVIEKIRENRADKGKELTTIMCAESYKVKDIESIDRTRVMSCTPEEYDYIVTDKDVFKVVKKDEKKKDIYNFFSLSDKMECEDLSNCTQQWEKWVKNVLTLKVPQPSLAGFRSYVAASTSKTAITE